MCTHYINLCSTRIKLLFCSITRVVRRCPAVIMVLSNLPLSLSILKLAGILNYDHPHLFFSSSLFQPLPLVFSLLALMLSEVVMIQLVACQDCSIHLFEPSHCVFPLADSPLSLSILLLL